MSRFSLKQQLAMVMAALVLVAGVTVGMILKSERDLGAHTGRLLDHQVPLMDLVHQLNMTVVEVQQWLSDISATRGQDGLNDGFEEAAKSASRFKALIGRLVELDPQSRHQYLAMDADFDRYYEVGKQMASAYVEGGPAAGNAVMGDFDAAAEALSDRLSPFLERVRQTLSEQAARDREMSSSLLYVTAGGVVAFLFVVVTMGWVFRGIFRTIGHDPAALQKIADTIAAGDLEQLQEDEPQATGLYRSLLQMRNELRDKIGEMNGQLAENGRMRSALDNADAAMTVSDEANQLIYMNDAARDFFDGISSVLSAGRPGFVIDDLLGKALGGYFSDSAVKEVFARPLTERVSMDTELEGRYIRFVANPVYGQAGEYLGRVTQWEDRTAEVEAIRREAEQRTQERREAAENQRIREALDNVTSAVMVADQGYDIIYVNHALERLFGEAEEDLRKALPDFDAAALRGSNMDVFHRDPAHQRAMLDHVRGTVQSEVEVAGLTLNIVANPVVAADGERLGTVVEWKNRTGEVAVEREIDRIVAAARNGELGRRITLDGKDGFFRQLGLGMNQLLDVVENGFTDVAAAMKRMAEGDLTQPITREYAGVFDRVKQDVNATIQNIQQVVQQLCAASDSISTASGEISSGNTNLSARTEQQASALQQTAASMEELTSTVRNNAENARTADQVVSGASQRANQGGEVVGRAVTAMQEINDASERIAEIIGVIDEIAFQTNLLALNASVEAARAGEQGRGFAVVATEVRNLASRSAEAAKEIKGLIQDSVLKVKAGSELVDESGSTLDDIVVNVKKVGDIMAEIAAASGEQQSGIEQVNQAVTAMDEVTQQNAALAEETSAASAALNEKAGEMRQLVGFFKVAGETPPASAKLPQADVAPKPRFVPPAVVPAGRGAAIELDGEWEEF